MLLTSLFEIFNMSTIKAIVLKLGLSILTASKAQISSTSAKPYAKKILKVAEKLQNDAIVRFEFAPSDG